MDLSNDEDNGAKASELHDDLESKTMELFATRARVDDLRIRSFADYLEEMARNSSTRPANPSI